MRALLVIAMLVPCAALAQGTTYRPGPIWYTPAGQTGDAALDVRFNACGTSPNIRRGGPLTAIRPSTEGYTCADGAHTAAVDALPITEQGAQITTAKVTVPNATVGVKPSYCLSTIAAPIAGQTWGGATLRGLVGAGANGSANSLRLFVSTGALTFDLLDNAGSQLRQTFTMPSPDVAPPHAGIDTAAAPHWIAVGVSGATMSLYVDGVKRTTTQSGAGTGLLSAVPAKLTLGSLEDGLFPSSMFFRSIEAFPSDDCTRAKARPIVAIGDSITQGNVAGRSYTWRLNDVLLGPHRYVNNLGVSGYTVAQATTRYTTYAKGQYKNARAIVLLGINDILADSTGAATWTALNSLVDTMLADGFSVVLLTVLPFKGYVGWSAGRQTQLDALNTSIRAKTGVAVIDANVLFNNAPTDAQTLKAAWDGGDHLHPNATGEDALADILAPYL